MNAHEQLRASRTRSGFDKGPTVEEVDRELRELSESTLERYAAALDLNQLGGRSFEYLDDSQQKAMRAGNELARRRRVSEQEAARVAEDARVEALHTARVEERIAVFRASAHVAFPGTAPQFEQAWPRLLADWQAETMRAEMEANMAAVRARIGSVL